MKFNFNNEFKCQLQCQQCRAINARHQRCGNRVCIGVPYCWVHLPLKKKLKIKGSTIPNAGKGLFAYDASKSKDAIIFSKDQVIIAYRGNKIDLETLEMRYGEYTAPYTVQVAPDRYIDSSCKRGIASLANAQFNKKLINAELVNYDDMYVKIVAIKNIRNNREIFISYGDEYKFDENVHYSTK